MECIVIQGTPPRLLHLLGKSSSRVVCPSDTGPSPFWSVNVSKSRREFLVRSTAMLASAAAAAQQPPGKDSSAAKSQQTPEGTPPAFGTAPAVGPEVNPATFAAAEKLVQVDLTEADRAMAAASWRTSMAALYER